MKKITLLALALLLAISCSRNPSVKNESETSYERFRASKALAEDFAMAPSGGVHMLNETKDQKIIQKASLNYEVQDLDTAYSAVSELINEYKGFVSSESRYESGNRVKLRLQIKIPAKKFNSFLKDIEEKTQIRKVNRQSISASDVTERHIDLSSRLETKRSFLAKYKDLLQKAESVQDIMTVQDKIRRLEEEIESTQKQLNYLNDRIAMATLDIELYEIIPERYVPEKNDFTHRMLKSLHRGWTGIVNVFFWLIGIWPIWILICAAGLISSLRKKE